MTAFLALMRRTARSSLTGKRMSPVGNNPSQLTCSHVLPNSRWGYLRCFWPGACAGAFGGDNDFPPMHEAQPEVSPLHFRIDAWEAMTYRYISDVMDGTRRLLRTFPDDVRKTEYRRKALPPGPQGQPRWEFSTTWLMDRHTGYWLPISIPKMEAKISKSAWNAVLQQPTKQLRAAGETPTPLETLLTGTPHAGKTSPYPAGMPLRPGEIQRARGHRPKSLEGGESL